MKKFSHVYSIAFTVESNMPEGEDVLPADFIVGCLRRMTDTTENNEWFEAAALEDTTEILP